MRLALALAAVLTVAACEQPVMLKPVTLSTKEVAAVQDGASYYLFDPSAAVFRNLRAADVTMADGTVLRRVCGEINGKNQFGGYVGFEPFSGFLNDGKFVDNPFSGPCA